MQFIDTHIHLQDDKSNNATDIISQALNQGCAKMICVSAMETDWEKVAELAKQYPDIIVPAFGVHPWYISKQSLGWQTRLQQMLEQFPHALIGECGLDGFKPDIEHQKQIFREQIEMAKHYNRPLIVHAVKAVSLLSEFLPIMPRKFVVHGFNGKKEFLQMIIKAGGYIGIGDGLLKTAKAGDILKAIPTDKMLFETDAPFQAEFPWQIKDYLDLSAKLLNSDSQSLAAQVYDNTMEFIK